uniref:Uncharacterized protein n=1 Tax=Anguilla anguilla TaxID=7936 RepID=A0A0E9Q3K1_ANGAN
MGLWNYSGVGSTAEFQRQCTKTSQVLGTVNFCEIRSCTKL